MNHDIQTERFGESLADDPPKQSTAGGTPYAPVANNKHSENEGCGCWAYGCLGVVVLGVLLVAGLGFGGYWFVAKQVENYTDVEPNQIPAVEMDEEALVDLQDRIESFANQVAPAEDGTEPDQVVEGADAKVDQPLELVLTAREINALIHANENLQGRAHVVIANGTIQAKVSIPADQVVGGKGRYFNADAEIEVAMKDGILVVRVVDAKIKDQSLPEALLKGFSQQNLAKEVYEDPNAAEMLRRFDSIEVIEDSIHLRLRQPDRDEKRSSVEAGESVDVPAELPLEFEPAPAAGQ